METRETPAAASLSHETPPEAERLAVAADVFRLLSDPTRLHLLWVLGHREADVTELTEACAASRTAVSQHLAKLRLAGLVESRKQSRHAIYRLRDGHLRRLVLEAVNHADHVVTGEPPHH
ncbi:ArsR/SmtB family transcription factor [Streptomonospora wellingtoniae]|uniref:Metalloregulator ArsR/SmtB family transcription factor n=1 Tax=Streptomonospora wellingtoniae TaxID=3075544 RepID=A0ABU2KQA8_9ACTN|nr:metalloregulator ArsR/SmtB family transcription factor [Streptomonospora sp. DSM 45055]MDT0301443.1 metalloregulator ArsR/SmtB family transcription factor [Streptomonospora sp. DSM 45055]